MARVDRSLIRIVFENLLGNAWRFTAGTQGARIEIGAKIRSGGHTYFVRDNGAGFDMTRSRSSSSRSNGCTPRQSFRERESAWRRSRA